MSIVTARRFAIFLLLFSLAGQFAQSHSIAAGSDPPPARRLTGKLNYLEAACGSVGIELATTGLPAAIKAVKLGTPAFHAGLRKDDRIVDIKVEDGLLKLNVERNGTRFAVPLATNLRALRGLPASAAQSAPGARRRQATASKGNLAKQIPASDSNSRADLSGAAVEVKLPAAVQGNELKSHAERDDQTELLRRRQIILIIDRSGSMGAKDPSCDTLSRFEWCKQAISELADSKELASSRFTLIFFNTGTDVIRDADLPVVERMFGMLAADGGTDLNLALKTALALQKSNGQPDSVVAVLHDGIVNRPNEISSLLINAGNSLSSPKQLAITFLQIGQDAKGTNFLNQLDTALVTQGARFDIVDTIPFTTLKQVGLKAALTQAIREAMSSDSR